MKETISTNKSVLNLNQAAVIPEQKNIANQNDFIDKKQSLNTIKDKDEQTEDLLLSKEH